MEKLNCPPILFVIFNRPDLTEKVFQEIKLARPEKLFIAADGPRPDHSGEKKLCDAARKIIDDIDWECEVRSLFNDHNRGCKLAVSNAISWFFEHVEEGIILEDDCLPDPSFFRYCSELLLHYRENSRVMMISGDNFQRNICNKKKSYYFSIYNHIWGWATWRRAWELYDGTLQNWPQLKGSNWLKNIHHNKDAVAYWKERFERSYSGEINSWAYPWAYSCWVNNGLTILPSINLVKNIGFDDRGTHLKTPRMPGVNSQTIPIVFPLEHDDTNKVDHMADRYTFITHYKKSKISGFILLYYLSGILHCIKSKLFLLEKR